MNTTPDPIPAQQEDIDLRLDAAANIETAAGRIRGLARVIDYAMRQDAKTGDGPSVMSFSQCFAALGDLCDQIDKGVDQLRAAHVAEHSIRA